MLVEEKILVGEIRKRNKDVFESIFREYYTLLKSFAYHYIPDKLICDDIIQDLFVHLWNNAGQLYVKTSLRAYLIQSIKNRCLNYLRDLKIHDRHEILYLESIFNLTEDELIADEELFQKVKKAINELPAEIAQVFLLKYYDGKKVKEISQIKKMSPNTVKKQLQKAKELLKESLLT